MKFSERWLRKWVDPPLSTSELVGRLTGVGLEVESVEPVNRGIEKVVAAEVVAVGRHPGAERLSLCQVDAGTGELLPVVCGAPNLESGMRAAMALPGARLPEGATVRRRRIRGERSHGMLCSARELGLGEEADRILRLSPDAGIGGDLREVLELEDVTIDIELTPNRGDCLGIAGISREVGAFSRMAVAGPSCAEVPARIDDVVDVRLDAPADCPRYVGRILRDIDPRAETPLWIGERLRRSGLRALSPVVDVTNYVMLELGQPMHAFDLEVLGPVLRVRRARTGERLTLLDGATLDLDPEALVIAGRNEALALAGVMGGSRSGVSGETRHVMLESAWFLPRTVAAEARRRGLHTDASHRFERAVASDLQRRAVERATALLLDIVGGRPGPVVDACRRECMPAPARIALRACRIRRLLGMAMASEDVIDILTRLGMTVTERSGGEWQVSVPAFRPDLRIEADLIEELARVHGYERIPSRAPVSALRMLPRSESKAGVAEVGDLLASRGYQEAMTFSFVDAELQGAMETERVPVALANPISSEMAVMRTRLWPGLVRAMLRNTYRQRARVRLFEIGLVFHDVSGEVRQEPAVAGLATGPLVHEQWGAPARNCDFFDVKGDVEALLARCRVNGGRGAFEASSHPALHPGRCARILSGGTLIGLLGEVHPDLSRTWKHPFPVYLFELALAALPEGSPPRFQALSRHPAVRRDLAVVVDAAVTAGELGECIGQAGVEVLADLALFDVYCGEHVEPGRKSMAVGLTFRHLSRTLTDAEVEEGVRAIVEALAGRLGAELRG